MPAAPSPSTIPLEQRIRQSQVGVAARQGLADVAAKLKEGAHLPSLVDLSGLTSVLARIEAELKKLNAREKCIHNLLEQNYGALEDEQAWLPFAFNVPANTQVVTSALVDQDSTFYYRGYAAPEVAGVSYQEVIDGVQGAEHFVPPSQPNDAAGYQYGTKGKRVFGRVDVVISNANAFPVTIDGFFIGRFRKGGR